MGLYINWANASFCIILGKPPTFNLPIKNHPSLRWLFFSDVTLVLNYHGCKEEAINLLPHYLINIINKLVKPSHLERLQIIQNINKLMIQVIFTFSYQILIKQHSFLHPCPIGGRKQSYTWSFDWRTEAWVKMHRFNVFSRNVNIINWKNLPHPWWNIQARENSTSILERDKTLRKLKKYERMYPWG